MENTKKIKLNKNSDIFMNEKKIKDNIERQYQKHNYILNGMCKEEGSEIINYANYAKLLPTPINKPNEKIIQIRKRRIISESLLDRLKTKNSNISAEISKVRDTNVKKREVQPEIDLKIVNSKIWHVEKNKKSQLLKVEGRSRFKIPSPMSDITHVFPKASPSHIRNRVNFSMVVKTESSDNYTVKNKIFPVIPSIMKMSKEHNFIKSTRETLNSLDLKMKNSNYTDYLHPDRKCKDFASIEEFFDERKAMKEIDIRRVHLLKSLEKLM